MKATTRDNEFREFFAHENARLQRFATMLVGDPNEGAELAQGSVGARSQTRHSTLVRAWERFYRDRPAEPMSLASPTSLTITTENQVRGGSDARGPYGRAHQGARPGASPRGRPLSSGARSQVGPPVEVARCRVDAANEAPSRAGASMRRELRQVRHNARRPAREERDLPECPTSIRERSDEVAGLVARINHLVG